MADLENNEILDDIDNVEEEVETSEVEEQEEEQQQEETKQLTQKDIDKIVESRLKRERAKYTDYEEIVEALKDYGYQGTAAEIKASIKAAVDQDKKQRELLELEDEAKKYGVTPDILAEMKEIKKELADIKAKEKEALEKQKAIQEQDQEFEKQVKDLTSTYNVNMEELAKDKQFVKFVDRSNPKLSLKEIYEDYMELRGEADKLALEKVSSKVNRSTSSGRSKVDGTGGTYGLSAEQQKLAKDNGMTYKEYFSRLSMIKKK